jgi:hypothetical protein
LGGGLKIPQQIELKRALGWNLLKQ